MFGCLINTIDRLEGWEVDSEDSGFDQEKCCLFLHKDRIGYVSFHYFKRAFPYERVLLMNDVTSKFSKVKIYGKFINTVGGK